MYWKYYLVILDQIYHDKNAFKWVKKNKEFGRTRFERSKHDLLEELSRRLEMCQTALSRSSELEFSKIFGFPSTSIEPKKYFYLVDSKNVGCFEKL